MVLLNRRKTVNSAILPSRKIFNVEKQAGKDGIRKANEEFVLFTAYREQRKVLKNLMSAKAIMLCHKLVIITDADVDCFLNDPTPTDFSILPAYVQSGIRVIPYCTNEGWFWIKESSNLVQRLGSLQMVRAAACGMFKTPYGTQRYKWFG